MPHRISEDRKLLLIGFNDNINIILSQNPAVIEVHVPGRVTAQEFNNMIDQILCAKHSSIKSIRIHGGEQDLSHLAELLKHNSTITSLELYRINIGIEGSKAIREVLKVNSSITNLMLYEVGLGIEGTKAIASALQSNKTLMRIDLSWNEIGNEGAIAISKVLEVNNTLKSRTNKII